MANDHIAHGQEQQWQSQQFLLRKAQWDVQSLQNVWKHQNGETEDAFAPEQNLTTPSCWKSQGTHTTLDILAICKVVTLAVACVCSTLTLDVCHSLWHVWNMCLMWRVQLHHMSDKESDKIPSQFIFPNKLYCSLVMWEQCVVRLCFDTHSTPLAVVLHWQYDGNGRGQTSSFADEGK